MGRSCYIIWYLNFHLINQLNKLIFLVLGFSITWIVRWFFPLAQPAYFGAIIQVAQATVVTVYLALSTNTWSREATSDDGDDADGADEHRSKSHFPIQKVTHSF